MTIVDLHQNYNHFSKQNKTTHQKSANLSFGIDTFFLIWAAALMFFMQAGFAMLCAGSVRQKNVQNTMLKNLLDACGAAIGFWSFGFALAYGGDDDLRHVHSENGNNSDGSSTIERTFVGDNYFFLMNFDYYAVWMFQFAFAATSATIVAGTLAERCQMTAYLMYSFLLTGFVYPVVVHSIWSGRGFLSSTGPDPLFGTGMLDFAGSGVVHLTGGCTALIATMILGPRKGRFYHERTGEPIAKPRRVKGHSMSLQVLGTFILWFGWYGFNAGSTFTITNGAEAGSVASLAGVCTTLAGAAGCVTSLCVSTYRTERLTGEATFDLVYALNGCLSGLVSITAGCALVEPWAALVIGIIAGFIYCLASDLLVRYKIDDAVDAIPVHMCNGIWGCLAVGLLANPNRVDNAYSTLIGSDLSSSEEQISGIFYSWYNNESDFSLLGAQVVGMLFIIGWVLVIMTPFFLALSYAGWFRSDPLEEIVGLDISYHGGNAYHMDFPNDETSSAGNFETDHCDVEVDMMEKEQSYDGTGIRTEQYEIEGNEW